MTPRSPLVAGLFANRLLAPLIVGMAVVVALANAWLLSHPWLVRKLGITDFQDFYVAGKLALQGRAECAYVWECLRMAQIAEFGRWEYMPWAYPPQFTALVAGFATIPHAVSFTIFVLSTFALFAFAIFRLGGRYAAFGLALTMPAILINLRCGQNGFLTAGLIGTFAWAFLNRRDHGGLALGAMIVKPHLAVASAVAVLLRRRWGIALWAAAVVIGSVIGVTLWLGAGIWLAFRHASEASAGLLWQGQFPIERMTSVFAMVHRFGATPTVAMAAHVAVAGATLAGLAAYSRRCADERVLLSASTAATVLISPYNYDYDLTILAVALAMIAPVIINRITAAEVLVLGLLSWLSAANFAIMMTALTYVAEINHHRQVWTVSALCIFGMVAIVANVLRRPEAQPDRAARLQELPASEG